MTRLSDGLLSNGWFDTVDIVILTRREPPSYQIRGGVRAVDIGVRRLRRAVFPLARYLSAMRPHTVLSAGETANLITLCASRLIRRRERTVISVHTNLSADRAHARWNQAFDNRRIIPSLVRRMYPLADAVVAVSAGVAEDLRDNWAIPSELVRVIHNPVASSDIDTLQTESVDHAWLSQPREAPVVLAAGRLVPQKDYPTLLRAFAVVQREVDVRLIVLGQGPLQLELIALAESLGVRHCFDLPGFVTNPYAWMGRADVFVLSSAWEGFGNVLVEALACGTPVVSTDCPSGPSEILDGGRFGKLVPVADHKALATAILETLAVPRPSDALRGRARDFSLPKIIPEYGQLLSLKADP